MKKKSIKNILMLTSVLALGGVTVGALTACEGGETTGAYSVTIEGSAGAVCTPSATSADAGETITLTFTVSDGYQLQTVSVVDESGASVAVAGTGTTWTFVMPSSSVKVSYVCQTTQSYSITLSYTTADVRVQSSARSARGGTTITLSLTLGSGKYLNGITVTGESGTNVAVNGSGTTYSFIMPAENVTVTIATGAYEYTVTVADVTGVTVTTNLAVGQNPTYNTPIEVTVVANDPSSTAIIGLEVSAGSANVSVDQTRYGVYSFRMPASNITIRPVVTQMTEDMGVVKVLQTLEAGDSGYALAVEATSGEFYSGYDATGAYWGYKEFNDTDYLYQRGIADSEYSHIQGWHDTTDASGAKVTGNYNYTKSGLVGDFLHPSAQSYKEVVYTLSDFINDGSGLDTAFASASNNLNYWEVNTTVSDSNPGYYFANYLVNLLDINTLYNIDRVYIQSLSSTALQFIIETSLSDDEGSASVTYEGQIFAGSETEQGLNIDNFDFTGVTFTAPADAKILEDTTWTRIVDDLGSSSFSASYNGADYWFVGGDNPYASAVTTTGGAASVIAAIFFDNDGQLVFRGLNTAGTAYITEVIMTKEVVDTYINVRGYTKEDIMVLAYNNNIWIHPESLGVFELAHLADNQYWPEYYLIEDYCNMYGIRTILDVMFGLDMSKFAGENYVDGYGFKLTTEGTQADHSDDAITLAMPVLTADGKSIGLLTYYYQYTNFGKTSAASEEFIEEYLAANPGTDAGETPAE